MLLSDCVYASESQVKGTFRCNLIYELYQIDGLPANPESPRHPCGKCKAEWGDNPPTKEAPTEVILSFASLVPTETPELPAWEAVPTPFAVHRVEGGESREVKIRQRPDNCFYMEKVLNFTGCCSMRTWQCELHGEVRARDCEKCPDYLGHEA